MESQRPSFLYSAVYPKFSLTVFEDILSRLKLSAAGRLSSFQGHEEAALYRCCFCDGCRTLLLDEAFDGLDPLARLTLKQILVDKTMNKGTLMSHLEPLSSGA